MTVMIGAATIGLFALSGAAGAAAPAGYPPPVNLNTSASSSQSVTAGTSVTVVPTCSFKAGTAITVTFNGAAYNSGTASAAGTFPETFTSTAAPTLSLNGGPPVAVKFGVANTIVASGTNTGGGVCTATTMITVVSKSGAVPSSTATTTPSGLAFTGADIMAMVIGALALLALGFLILTFSRRRRTSS